MEREGERNGNMGEVEAGSSRTRDLARGVSSDVSSEGLDGPRESGAQRPSGSCGHGALGLRRVKGRSGTVTPPRGSLGVSACDTHECPSEFNLCVYNGV